MIEKGYIPPYTITDKILSCVISITELVTKISIDKRFDNNPRLRRDSRIKTIQASLEIENNSLTLQQVTDIVNGKRVLGSEIDIHEVKNAFSVYENMPKLEPYSINDMLKAHEILMHGLTDDVGKFRSKGVGVFADTNLVHIAPPAKQVPILVKNLVDWAKHSDLHQLIKSCIFHYELEFIHPFSDGNGRMGRLWQTLLLSRWNKLFAWLPVETMVRNSQAEYYKVLGECDNEGDSTKFIEFMLDMIEKSLLDICNTDQVTVQVTDQVKALLSVMKDKQYSALELMKLLKLSHKPTFRKNYINVALELGLIEMTIPNTPTHRNQKYMKVKQLG